MATFHGHALKVGLDAVLALGTPKLYFMATTYTANPDNSYWSDISASQASGTTAVTLTSVTTTYDATNNRVTLDCADPSLSSITTTTDQFVIIVDTGTASTSPIVFSGSNGATLTPVDGTLSLTINASGICGLNAAAA